MDINQIPAGAVVVGIDGTEHSDRAIDEAVQKADAESRELVLVHSLDDAASVLALIGRSEPTPYLTEIEAAGRRILAEGVARAAGDRARRVSAVLARTDPRIALIDASERASVIFIGSRGRGPVGTLLLGSVSVAVARHAACPVVVVRPHGPDTPSHGVLVGTDASETSLPVLEFAYRSAAELSAPLRVLHAVWDPPAPAAADGRSRFPDGELALSEALAGLAEKFPEVTATGSVVWGDPAGAILEAAGGVQLVVVGRRARGGSAGRWAGTLAVDVAEHARTSVAVVPQD